MQLKLLETRHARCAAVLAAVAFAAGCASLERAAAPTPAQPVVAPEVPAPSTVEAPKAAPAPVPAVTVPPPASVPATVPKTEAPVTKPPAKIAAAPVPVPSASVLQPTKSAPAVAAAPALDLKSLETRLRETKAIGVMTKLALKNQVDDLLDQFRLFYQGKVKTTLVELRRSYDLLLLKVLALLQDADPPLANAIAMSREAIWGILSDPVKFSSV